MTSLTELGVQQALTGLAAGEFSSCELTSACLERIDALEPKIKAFITLMPEQAMAQARKADRRYKDRKPPADLREQPLLGLPIAVKDILAVEGIRCTCGSRILEDYIPPYTATAVARLQAAGAVVVGKTNLDEFAMGSSTENSAFGATANPWEPSCVPGGSSGGSAAAVAACLVPGALGTDTGGSVRQPASFCGITGLKPTYGRVSRYGLVAYGSSLDTAGVFARSAADAALIFACMAGVDPLDATTRDVPAPDVNLNQPPLLKGIRIGLPQEYFIAGIQPEVEAAVRFAVGEFERLGCEVRPVSLPHTDMALPVYYLIAPAEASANLARFDGVRYGLCEEDASLKQQFRRTRGAGFGAEVKRRIMLGTYALSAGYYDAYYGQAQKVRELIRQDFAAAFKEVDAIAAPVAPTTAFRLGAHTDDPLAMYLEDVFTLPANLAGIPGLAFPAGFDSAGLPIGMQLMAAQFREDTLLRLAHAYQGATDWHLRRPMLT